MSYVQFKGRKTHSRRYDDIDTEHEIETHHISLAFYGISLCTDIAHEKKITGLPQIWILTLSLLNLTSPNFCIQAYTREYAAHQENW